MLCLCRESEKKENGVDSGQYSSGETAVVVQAALLQHNIAVQAIPYDQISSEFCKKLDMSGMVTTSCSTFVSDNV